MATHSFASQFKRLTNSQLLEILNNEGDYTSNAITAARAEIELRNIPQSEINEINSEINLKKENQVRQQQNIAAVKDKIILSASELAEDMYAVKKEPTSVNRFIQILSFMLLMSFTYEIYTQAGFLWFIIHNPAGKVDISTVAYFMPLIITPIAGWFFWRRKRIGWIILSVFMFYVTISLLSSFLVESKIHANDTNIVQILFPSRLHTPGVITILFSMLFTWLVVRKPMRIVYKVEQKHFMLALFLGFTFSMIIWGAMLLETFYN